MKSRSSQMDLAGCDREAAGVLAQRKADAPLKPRKPQEACDVGLFSDEPRQLDLVTLANTARKT